MLEKVQQELELLGRHLDVVRAVVEQQPIGIMKLADVLDLPAHRVRYSLKILEQMGYIKASQSGAVATPRALEVLDNLETEIDALIAKLQAMKEKAMHNL